MNWIILIIAGLFEVGFTFCLGKIKGATGTDVYLWGTGIIISVTLSMYRIGRHFVLPWTGHFRTPVLYDNSDSFNHRIETNLNLIIRIQGDTPLSSGKSVTNWIFRLDPSSESFLKDLQGFLQKHIGNKNKVIIGCSFLNTTISQRILTLWRKVSFNRKYFGL